MSSNQNKIGISGEKIYFYGTLLDVLAGWTSYHFYQVGGYDSNKYELRQYREVFSNGNSSQEYLATRFIFTPEF